MSEETAQDHSDGTWSGLKKTIIGTVSTAVLAGGTWITTTLFNGGGDKEETKTEQAAPAQPVINVNLENNNTNQQKQSSGAGTNTIIKERVIEKQAAPAASTPAAEPAKPAKKEEDSW
jgi:flagellar basal body-associated protein FliL